MLSVRAVGILTRVSPEQAVILPTTARRPAGDEPRRSEHKMDAARDDRRRDLLGCVYSLKIVAQSFSRSPETGRINGRFSSTRSGDDSPSGAEVSR